MKEDPPSPSVRGRTCRSVFPFAAAVAIGAALSVSNGAAVGIAVGAGLVAVALIFRRR